MFDLDWIRRLIEMIDDSDLDTIEISRFGTRVVLSKSPPVTARLSMSDVVANPNALPGANSAPPATAASEPVAAPTVAAEAEDESVTDDGGPTEELLEVNSPMVGTFYRAPAPDAPPYVEIGDRVVKGQTLCILEAMKLMNELESDVGGVVREVSVQNAEPVEYGQVLFRIALDGAG